MAIVYIEMLYLSFNINTINCPPVYLERHKEKCSDCIMKVILNKFAGLLYSINLAIIFSVVQYLIVAGLLNRFYEII